MRLRKWPSPSFPPFAEDYMLTMVRPQILCDRWDCVEAKPRCFVVPDRLGWDTYPAAMAVIIGTSWQDPITLNTYVDPIAIETCGRSTISGMPSPKTMQFCSPVIIYQATHSAWTSCSSMPTRGPRRNRSWRHRAVPRVRPAGLRWARYSSAWDGTPPRTCHPPWIGTRLCPGVGARCRQFQDRSRHLDLHPLWMLTGNAVPCREVVEYQTPPLKEIKQPG